MLKAWLSPKTDFAYALLRIVSGAMFAFHGMQKIFGILSPMTPHFPQQVWFGGIIELVGGTLIALGAYTTCAAFITSGQMAVAYVQFHWKLAFDSRFFPPINKGELAILYSFLFLYIACRGAGIWSVNQRRKRS